MKRKHRARQGSVVIRYGALLFLVLVVLAGLLAFMLMQFAVNRFVCYEETTMLTGMQLAADDLENQYGVMEDIANKIGVTTYYQPTVVRMDAYRDIELLQDFVYFRNFSPLPQRYFLLYPELSDNREKIFTSDGSTSYFSFYARTALGLQAEEAEVLLEHLEQVRQGECVLVGEQVLMIFPIRFVSSPLPDSRAVMTFILSLGQLRERMEQVAAGLPESFSLRTVSLPVLRFEQGSFTRLTFLGCEETAQESGMLSVYSAGGEIIMTARHVEDKWALLITALPRWLFAGIVLSLAVVAAVSILLARVMARPLRQLIEQHTPPGERIRNEFVQLEEMVTRMEQENGSSMRLMRSRVLINMLRGYYSESLHKRWGFLHLEMDHACCSVAVLDASGLEDAEAEKRSERIEGLTDGASAFYAVMIPEDHVHAVIVGAETGEACAEALRRLQELARGWGAACSVGKCCDTPQRLPISYMEAMTAHLRAMKWQSEPLCDMHVFAVQLVTAAGRGDTEGMRQLCDQLLRQAEENGATRTATSGMAAQLTAELGVLAGEQHVELDRQRAGMLTLLPTLPLLLKDACELVQDTFYRDREKKMSRVDETAQAIVEYVKENACDADFDLSRIAERFGLSNDYVSAMIKKVTGSAFKEYLTELRMEKARALLDGGSEQSVNEIGLQVGYRKASNFIRKFRETYGCTPAQYRQTS